MGCPIVFRGPNGAAARVAAQHSQDYSAWYSQMPGPEGRPALHRRRRQGPAQGGDPRPQPGHLPRERNPLRPVLRGAEARRLRPADRQGEDRAAGKDVTIVSFGIGMTYALKAAAELEGDGDRRRGDRPPDPPPARPRYGGRVDQEDQPLRHRRGGLAGELDRQLRRLRDHGPAPSTVSTRRWSKVTGKDVPMPYAANLEKLALPSVAEVIEAVKAVTYR